VSGDPLTSRGDFPQTPSFDFDEHVLRFNVAVDTGDWSQFTDRFAEDASLEFIGPPIGPFTGREAIHRVYALHPPDDKIELYGPVVADFEELVVPFRWARTRATGTMRVTEQSGQIARLVVTFN
jgi:steroid Delta-isomerase